MSLQFSIWLRKLYSCRINDNVHVGFFIVFSKICWLVKNILSFMFLIKHNTCIFYDNATLCYALVALKKNPSRLNVIRLLNALLTFTQTEFTSRIFEMKHLLLSMDVYITKCSFGNVNLTCVHISYDTRTLSMIQ